MKDVGFVGFDLLVDVEHCGGNDIEDLDFLNSVRSTKGSSGSISCYKSYTHKSLNILNSLIPADLASILSRIN